MDAGLYIVGTPIGNLGDISPRAVEALGEADLIIAEDTRQTRKLLTHFELRTEMMSCHKFNEAARLEGIISRIQSGQAVVQVSDSGMPTISDPGARMVAACREAGLMVTAIPGPTAVTTAVALSGYGEHGFAFIGFPPRKPGKIRKLLRQWQEVELPVVLYESPYRVLKLIGFVEEVFGPEQEVFFVRELTKKFEEMHTGTAEELRAAYDGREVKGECVIVISPDRFVDDRN
ncbi:16S rRNA (cytidine(1402)-2'-O)-methyltransferase [Verrucomicrobiota bacterium]